MNEREAVAAQIRAAFGGNPFPGDAFLQGSFDGSEPYDEVRHFHGRADWTALDPEFLDARYCALGFLSEAGFRYFLPAFLIADLQGRLQTADPAFHLTHGWFASSSEHTIDGRVFVRSTGPHVVVNPRRYGAMTWGDQARYRLSVFTREEVRAIVAYLRWRRASAETELERAQVDQALGAYWLERAESAPTAARLSGHERDEADYAAALGAGVARSVSRDDAPPGPGGSTGP